MRINLRKRLTQLPIASMIFCAAVCGPGLSATVATDTESFLMTVDGEIRRGAISHIVDGAAYQLQLDSQPTNSATRPPTQPVATNAKTPLSDVLRIETGNPAVFGRIKSLVILTNGDRLAVDTLKMQDEALVCRTSTDNDLQIPIEFIQAFVLQYPRSAAQRRSLLSTLDQHTEDNDVLMLKNGDRIRGELLSLTPIEATLQTDSEEFTAPRSGIKAVAMNVALAAKLSPPDEHFIVLLTDGSSITVSTLELTKAKLSCTTLFDTRFIVALKHVTTVLVRNDRIVPLSQLKPAAWDYTPFISGQRKLNIDRNSAGNDLLLAGRRYPFGLGMHSKSVATYKLDNKYAGLISDFGIDDQATGQGSVEFRITVDGKTVIQHTVKGRSARQSTGMLSLRGTSQLTLEVDYAGRGDLFDIANWCEPILIRATK